MDSKEVENLIHKTIKKVTNDIETMKYNTAVSPLMILTNEFEKLQTITKTAYKTLLILLNPIAPHITEELNEICSLGRPIVVCRWPEYLESKTIDNEKEIAVQVNGKVRATIKIDSSMDEEEIKKLALNEENVIRHTKDKNIVKIIIIKDKIVNIVIKDQ